MPRLASGHKIFHPAASVQAWLAYLTDEGGSVLDYGAGMLRNALFLREIGMSVCAVELGQQIERIREKYPTLNDLEILEPHQLGERRFTAAICTYVLNILDRDTQQQVVDNIVSHLVPSGVICVEVRKKTVKAQNSLSRIELRDLFTPRGTRLLAEREGPSFLAQLYTRENFGQLPR